MNIRKIIVGPIQVNCFLVTCTRTHQTAIIDPGDNAEKILRAVADNNLDVKYILLTHAHFDHIGAVAPVKQATGAEILLHRDDLFLVENAAFQAQALGFEAPETFQIDRFIDESDVITFGDLSATVIATPGHSPGGVCFYFDNDLFAGDTLFYGSIGRTDLPGGDFEQIIQSIQTKLFVLPDHLKVHSGHGPSTSIGREKKHNPFVT